MVAKKKKVGRPRKGHTYNKDRWVMNSDEERAAFAKKSELEIMAVLYLQNWRFIKGEAYEPGMSMKDVFRVKNFYATAERREIAAKSLDRCIKSGWVKSTEGTVLNARGEPVRVPRLIITEAGQAHIASVDNTLFEVSGERVLSEECIK